MKKSAAILSVLLAAAILISGCSFELPALKRSEDAVRLQAQFDADDSLQLYGTLSDREKEAYADFFAAVESRDEKLITIGSYDTQEDAEKGLDRWREMWCVLPYEHPEYFWLDMYEYLYLVEKELVGEYLLKIQPQYLMDEESLTEAKPRFDAKVDEIVREAESQPTLYDKVICVYDRIIADAEYDNELFEAKKFDDVGISAYGCLIDGKTICSGYAGAFCLIMRRLGIECGVEFDSYDGDADKTDGHVWNYCKLDGEYYYFDLTWDDSPIKGESGEIYADHTYTYFGIDREELKESHETSENSHVPHCDGQDYNYYIYGGMNLESYDFDAISEIIMAQQDKDVITIRFDDKEQTALAKSEFIGNSLLFDILPDIKSYSWLIPQTGHHLFIFVER